MLVRVKGVILFIILLLCGALSLSSCQSNNSQNNQTVAGPGSPNARVDTEAVAKQLSSTATHFMGRLFTDTYFSALSPQVAALESHEEGSSLSLPLGTKALNLESCRGLFSKNYQGPLGGTLKFTASCRVLEEQTCGAEMPRFFMEFKDWKTITLEGKEVVLDGQFFGSFSSQGCGANFDFTQVRQIVAGPDSKLLIDGDTIELLLFQVNVFAHLQTPLAFSLLKSTDQVKIRYGAIYCCATGGEFECHRQGTPLEAAMACEALGVPEPPSKDDIEEGLPPCMSCDSLADCPTGVACKDGRCDISCKDDSLCHSDVDCTSGANCIGGVCFLQNVCNGREPVDPCKALGPGGSCVGGFCIPQSCEQDADCSEFGGSCGPSGYCQNARCINDRYEIPHEPSDCGNRTGLSSACDGANFCSILVCGSNEDCKANGLCRDGICVPEGDCGAAKDCSGRDDCASLGARWDCVSGCCVEDNSGPQCGDHNCEVGEDCESCAADCGECQGCTESCGCENELAQTECASPATCVSYIENSLQMTLPQETANQFLCLPAGCCDTLRPLGQSACATDQSCQDLFGFFDPTNTYTCDESAGVCGVGSSGPSCGDRNCDVGETCSTCPGDCGACNPCGDRTCDSRGGEDCNTCPTDCGACNPCGDRTCDSRGGEDCNTCPTDCGVCGGGR